MEWFHSAVLDDFVKTPNIIMRFQVRWEDLSSILSVGAM